MLKYFHNEPDPEYREKAKEYMSSHRLQDFHRCPETFKAKEDGRIGDKDSSVYAFGRACHVYICEGVNAFENQFIVGGPINEKTGKPFGTDTLKFKSWADEHPDKTPISYEDYALIGNMYEGVHNNNYTNRFFDKKAMSEATLRTSMFGVDCQIRVDMLCAPFDEDDDYFSCWDIVDLKTCQNLDDFQDDLKKYGYLYQMAFYQMVVQFATRFEFTPHMVLMAVEKKAPYRCGIWEIDDDALKPYHKKIKRDLWELKCLRKSGYYHHRLQNNFIHAKPYSQE